MDDDHKRQGNISQTGDKPIVFISGTQQEHPSHSEEIAKQKPEKWSDLELPHRITFLLTFGIFLVAGITAIILLRQFHEMSNQTLILATQEESDAVSGTLSVIQIQRQLAIAQQQADAAQNNVKAVQRQMRQDQRAWIIPSPIQIACCDRPNEPVIAVGTYINSGKTPAMGIKAGIAIERVMNGESPQLNWKPAHEFQALGLVFPNNTPIRLDWAWSDSPVGTKPTPTLMTEEAIKEYDKGKFFFVAYGRVEYKDVFGVSHWVQFCTYGRSKLVPPGMTFTSRKCIDYASVDAN